MLIIGFCDAIETEAPMCVPLFTGNSYWSVFSFTASQDRRPSIMVCQLLLCVVITSVYLSHTSLQKYRNSFSFEIYIVSQTLPDAEIHVA